MLNQKKIFNKKRKLSFQDTINTIVTYDAGNIGRCIKRYIPKVEKTPTFFFFQKKKKKKKNFSKKKKKKKKKYLSLIRS